MNYLMILHIIRANSSPACSSNPCTFDCILVSTVIANNLRAVIALFIRRIFIALVFSSHHLYCLYQSLNLLFICYMMNFSYTFRWAIPFIDITSSWYQMLLSWSSNVDYIRENVCFVYLPNNKHEANNFSNCRTKPKTKN